MIQILILFLLLLPFGWSTSQALPASGARCYKLFSVDLNLGAEPLGLKLSEKMLLATTLNATNTTTVRAEDKVTLLQKDFKRVFAELSDRLTKNAAPSKLTLRDALRAGFHNVTWTRYTNKFSLDFKTGPSTTGVVRLRKYGWISEAKKVTRDHIELNPDFKLISNLEFKIRDPGFTDPQFKSVLKSIVKIYDADAEVLLSGELDADQLALIQKRTLDLNAQQSQTVNVMIDVLVAIRKQNKRLQMSYETLYQRSAYKLDISEPAQSGEKPATKRDVQITVDEHISTYVVAAGAYSKIYQTEQPSLVVETKIPLSFIADLKNPLESHLPVVAEAVAQFIQELRYLSLTSFEIGKGKLGHTIREFSED